MTDTERQPESTSLAIVERLGAAMHKARMFPGINNAEGAMAIILAGREMGFGPIASLTGIHLIKGKTTPSATLIAAAIRRSERYEYRLATLTNTECKIEFLERGQLIGTSEFTWQDAVNAGLSGGDNWKKFTRNMLFARAMSNGAKWFCPDLFGGNAVYVAEELGADVEEDGQAIDAEWRSSSPLPAGPVAEGSTLPPAPETAPTLDELVAQYGAERVMEAAGGGIPATAEDVAKVAEALAGA